MIIHVKIGSALRERLPQFPRGEGVVEIGESAGDSARVADVLTALGLSEEDVNLIYRNHVLVATSAHLQDGDRVALFPPNFIHFSQFYLQRKED